MLMWQEKSDLEIWKKKKKRKANVVSAYNELFYVLKGNSLNIYVSFLGPIESSIITLSIKLQMFL